MTEGARSFKEMARDERINELDRRIANLRWRRERDLEDGLGYPAARLGRQIEALVRYRTKLTAGDVGEGVYADLDRLDPAHAEKHRKEISRLYLEQHGLPALQKLGERCLADVRHEKERMRERQCPEGWVPEWVMGE